MTYTRNFRKLRVIQLLKFPTANHVQFEQFAFVQLHIYLL